MRVFNVRREIVVEEEMEIVMERGNVGIGINFFEIDRKEMFMEEGKDIIMERDCVGI